VFTNEQIREAMGTLVQEKGDGHRSYGRYSNPVTGKGECFLGALCEHMGLAVPAEGTAAHLVMGPVSPEMGNAFRIAQKLNDARVEWKYVLMAVDLILELPASAVAQDLCPCGCMVINSAPVTKVIQQVLAVRAEDQSREAAKRLESAAKDMAKAVDGLSVALKNATAGMSGYMTYNIPPIQVEKNTPVTASLFTTVPTQKEYALIA